MATMNGSMGARQRKSLAEQIDRLDGILDGLAEALNGAVADAVKEAVGAAVKEAVQVVFREVLTNPLVARTVAEAHGIRQEEPKAAKKGIRERLAGCWKRALAFAAAVASGAVQTAKSVVRYLARKGGEAVAKAALFVRNTRTVVTVASAFAGVTRRRVYLALGIGVVVAIGCYFAGPVVSSALCGVAASAASVVTALLRPLWPFLGFVPEMQEGARSHD